jgi:hypothetical protein
MIAVDRRMPSFYRDDVTTSPTSVHVALTDPDGAVIAT